MDSAVWAVLSEEQRTTEKGFSLLLTAFGKSLVSSLPCVKCHPAQSVVKKSKWTDHQITFCVFILNLAALANYSPAKTNKLHMHDHCCLYLHGLSHSKRENSLEILY